MRKRLLITLAAAFLCGAALQAQETYVATPVTISKEKVKFGDKVYYSHVVLEKQTLYSICKAYGVSLEDIYAANPDLKLETEGLKKNSILRIPTKTDDKEVKEDGTTTHIVKWYEDLEGIAAKYGVSVDDIVNANKDQDLSEGKLKARMKLIIPVKPGQASAEEAGEQEEQNQPQEDEVIAEVADTLATTEPEVVEPTIKNNISIALILPLNIASGKGTANYMDFYSGALMAARKAGENGLNVEISIYDDAAGVASFTESQLGGFDAVIGPVGKDNMSQLLSKAPKAATIVSPLDPRTGALTADNANLYQANSSTDDQYKEIAAWIKEEMAHNDRVVVISEKSKPALRNTIDTLLTRSGIDHLNFSYNILEGRNIGNTMNANFRDNVTNRVIIASDSEAFVNDVVRNLKVAAHSNFPVVLYGPSKMKSYETIDIENYHSLNLHMTQSYSVDYDDVKVKDFLLKYRAIFGTEPTNFAFQGYDLTYYFAQVCSMYGQDWIKYVGDSTTQMLQSAMRFSKVSENGGYVNTAVRRVIFNPDCKVTFIR